MPGTMPDSRQSVKPEFAGMILPAGSPRIGDWIQTYSARQFWPCDPRAEEIYIEDIAHALALQCRFTGHCKKFYSVAEHSVRVSRIVPDNVALWALLHDATEAYMSDLSRPLKRGSALGPVYRAMESRLMRVVCARFGLELTEPSCVKDADNILLMTEKRDLMSANGSLPKWVETATPLDDVIVPVSWEDAESLFLDRFNDLNGAISNDRPHVRYPECGGSGEIERAIPCDWPPRTCSRCHGTGEIEPKDAKPEERTS